MVRKERVSQCNTATKIGALVQTEGEDGVNADNCHTLAQVNEGECGLFDFLHS